MTSNSDSDIFRDSSPALASSENLLENMDLDAAMATLKTDTEVYQDEKAEHESKLVDLKRSVNEAASELELATNEHAVYTSAEVKERNRLEDLHTRIESHQQSVKTKAATLAELEETLEMGGDMEKENEELRKENQLLQLELEAMKADKEKQAIIMKR